MPFNKNFFLILNMALGGNFGGSVDPAFTQAQMEVDYVRVYQYQPRLPLVQRYTGATQRCCPEVFRLATIPGRYIGFSVT
jgi:beta-glucanase (GH16 family)